jgi:hypothetical protein
VPKLYQGTVPQAGGLPLASHVGVSPMTTRSSRPGAALPASFGSIEMLSSVDDQDFVLWQAQRSATVASEADATQKSIDDKTPAGGSTKKRSDSIEGKIEGQ